VRVSGLRPRAEALVIDHELAPELAEFVREVRATGIVVAVAVPGGRAVEDFDAVIDSDVPGAHKPTREFFARACEAVGRPPARCLFVDADDRSVRGARVAGLSAYRWNSSADLRYLRAALGR
jgi:putative hydrolase of the HAD superfamily